MDLGIDNAYAIAINNAGIIAGTYNTADYTHAFILDSGTLTDLGSLGVEPDHNWNYNRPYAINDAGQVVDVRR